MLGGATRMTLSITVLVMETTGGLQLVIPLMFTIFVAKTVGDYFGCVSKKPPAALMLSTYDRGVHVTCPHAPMHQYHNPVVYMFCRLNMSARMSTFFTAFSHI